MRTRRKTPVMTINVNGLDLMLSPRWDKKNPHKTPNLAVYHLPETHA